MKKEHEHNCVARENIPALIDVTINKLLDWLSNIKIVEKDNDNEVCGKCFESIIMTAFSDIMARMVCAANSNEPEKIRALCSQVIQSFMISVKDYSQQELSKMRKH